MSIVEGCSLSGVPLYACKTLVSNWRKSRVAMRFFHPAPDKLEIKYQNVQTETVKIKDQNVQTEILAQEQGTCILMIFTIVLIYVTHSLAFMDM